MSILGPQIGSIQEENPCRGPHGAGHVHGTPTLGSRQAGEGGNKRILSDYYNTSVSKATLKQLKWSPGEFTAIFLPSLLQNDRMVPCRYLLE